MEPKNINAEFGNMDLLLIDSILKERFDQHMRILDAGCGEGRNMVYFIRQGYNIYGMDKDKDMVTLARIMGSSLNSEYTRENIIQSAIEENPFPDSFFDLVMCINVLHSSEGKEHFFRQIDQITRILQPGGYMVIAMESEYVLTETQPSGKDRQSSPLPGPHNKLLLNNKLIQEILSAGVLKQIYPYMTLHIEGHFPETHIWLGKQE